MSDLPAPVSGGGSHHLGDNSENAKAPASQSVSTDTANAQDNSLLSDMSSERTVERDGTANASHSQLKSVSEATKKDHGPLAPSNENSPVLVDRKDASTPPAVPEKDKATGSATGGGAEGSHDMEQGPLKTVAEGGATDKAAIVDASEKLRTTNAKGDTDDPDLKDLGALACFSFRLPCSLIAQGGRKTTRLSNLFSKA